MVILLSQFTPENLFDHGGYRISLKNRFHWKLCLRHSIVEPLVP